MEKMEEKVYIASDLKSYYASVECVDRGLDPLKTNLVVADASRTEATICLAVSPSLKSYGISGRPRLFEVIAKVREINAQRLALAPEHKFTGSSVFVEELERYPELELQYIIAPPRMARYIEVSSAIYGIYLKYIDPEDIYCYSVDEVFIDATPYLKTYKLKPRELALLMIRDVLQHTGITATVGVGNNLYLCKIAMDIMAKRAAPDKDGVRIAELDELSYRKLLWRHRPLTDFWRIGAGYARRLERYGMYTMGDVACCSIGPKDCFYNADLLFKLFGVNAELLIDHAWGYEPCTMQDIKSYVPQKHSLSSGQVLSRPYAYDEGRLVVKEMADLLILDLVDKGLVTNQLVLTIGYDIKNIAEKNYQGAVKIDHYGRGVPRHAHGTLVLEGYTASAQKLLPKFVELYERIVDPKLWLRRIVLTAGQVVGEQEVPKTAVEQLELFPEAEVEDYFGLEQEKSLQLTMLKLHRKYGGNSILKGMNLEKSGTTRERNGMIGGHKA